MLSASPEKSKSAQHKTPVQKELTKLLKSDSSGSFKAVTGFVLLLLLPLLPLLFPGAPLPLHVLGRLVLRATMQGKK